MLWWLFACVFGQKLLCELAFGDSPNMTSAIVTGICLVTIMVATDRWLLPRPSTAIVIPLAGLAAWAALHAFDPGLADDVDVTVNGAEWVTRYGTIGAQAKSLIIYGFPASLAALRLLLLPPFLLGLLQAAKERGQPK